MAEQIQYEEICQTKVLIRGAGEQASGIAHRLHRSGFKVCLIDIAKPIAVRRLVSFCEAVYDGEKTVDQICQAYAAGGERKKLFLHAMELLKNLHQAGLLRFSDMEAAKTV